MVVFLRLFALSVVEQAIYHTEYIRYFLSPSSQEFKHKSQCLDINICRQKQTILSLFIVYLFAFRVVSEVNIINSIIKTATSIWQPKPSINDS